jgi:phosphatidylglycerophosphate synthase
MTRFVKLLQSWASQSVPERSFLASLQLRLAQRIVPVLPASLAVSDLSRIGLLGAVTAAIALVGCNWTPAFVALVPVGLAVNWFGASLDGPLARHRREFGSKLRLNNHLTDLVSFLTLIVAYGLSPFFTMTSAAMILACFLMFSAYHYLRAASGRGSPVMLIGLGATEFRVLLAIWPFAAQALGLGAVVDGSQERLNAATALLALMAMTALVVKAIVDAQRLSSAQN